MDNVSITPGTGVTVATDDVGGAQYQRMKLTDGTPDSSTPIPGTSTQGLYVDPHPSTVALSQVPVISTTTYTSGDVLGGVMTFPLAARIPGGAGLLQAVTMLDLAKQDAKIDLLLFTASFTSFGADNAAATVLDADLPALLGIVTFDPTNIPSDYTDIMTASNGSAIGQKFNLSLPFVCAPGNQSIFAQMIVRGTPTYVSAADLRVNLLILQD